MGLQTTCSDGPRTVVLKSVPHQRACENRTEPPPQRIRWGPGCCISNKILADAPTAGPGATLQDHYPRIAFLNLRTVVGVWGWIVLHCSIVV